MPLLRWHAEIIKWRLSSDDNFTQQPLYSVVRLPGKRARARVIHRVAVSFAYRNHRDCDGLVFTYTSR